MKVTISKAEKGCGLSIFQRCTTRITNAWYTTFLDFRKHFLAGLRALADWLRFISSFPTWALTIFYNELYDTFSREEVRADEKKWISCHLIVSTAKKIKKQRI